MSNRLVALEDKYGFVLALGIVQNYNVKSRQVTLKTPLESLDEVDTLHLGDITIEPGSFQDKRLEPDVR